MTTLSICMVSLNCWDVLRECLVSLRAIKPSLSYEIIMVDNGSTDATVANTRRLFPEVRVIENGRNVGFTRATNQGLALAQGKYLLWLNTDVILKPGSLDALCQFLDTHPEAGVVGPRVLNRDGTFQPQCKRGLPTPSASLAYMLKLDRLFPTHPVIGQYLLTYLPDDQRHQVDAVSGCCLLARREVYAAIGPLDEAIFAFGEDIDWCVRARQAGWEVWYDPTGEIIHLKGQGGVHSKPYHKAWGMHQGMWVFYRKHLIGAYASPVTALVWLGIWFSFAVACTKIFVQRTYRRSRPLLAKAGLT